MLNDTEQQILETARRHFIQYGFAATRMQSIADEAGINKAMLHYYFRSKEKLYNEIIAYTLRTIIPKLAGAMGSDGTFRERLEKLVETYVTTLINQPDIPFFILSELSHKREHFIGEIKKYASYFPAVGAFMQQINNEMEAGKIKKMPPVHLFLSVISMTVFPFIAKPVFRTVFEVSEEDFEVLMKERKQFILDFIDSALRVS